jgi:hypothetical protein
VCIGFQEFGPSAPTSTARNARRGGEAALPLHMHHM